MSKAKDIRDGMKTYMRMLMVHSKLESIYHVYIMPYTDKTTGIHISVLYAPNTHNPIPNGHKRYKFVGILERPRNIFHSRIILC